MSSAGLTKIWADCALARLHGAGKLRRPYLEAMSEENDAVPIIRISERASHGQMAMLGRRGGISRRSPLYFLHYPGKV